MEKLSAAQRRVLEAMKSGKDLVREFDVWGGYWHVLLPENTKVAEATVFNLKHRKLIEEGENKRLFSGRQRMSYSMTEAGRVAVFKLDPKSTETVMGSVSGQLNKANNR